MGRPAAQNNGRIEAAFHREISESAKIASPRRKRLAGLQEQLAPPAAAPRPRAARQKPRPRRQPKAARLRRRLQGRQPRFRCRRAVIIAEGENWRCGTPSSPSVPPGSRHSAESQSARRLEWSRPDRRAAREGHPACQGSSRKFVACAHSPASAACAKRIEGDRHRSARNKSRRLCRREKSARAGDRTS